MAVGPVGVLLSSAQNVKLYFEQTIYSIIYRSDNSDHPHILNILQQRQKSIIIKIQYRIYIINGPYILREIIFIKLFKYID